tara:strand:- start:48254 stop:49210 length:957 start_codon:yes stop_codon:yes gene_type:complete
MANSHKGNDGAWKEDKNIADATIGSLETMASEFWRVSGQDSSFVHQLENAKRELDDTVISEKENVRTVKQNAEQNQAVDTAQGNINMANQKEQFDEKMEVIKAQGQRNLEKNRSANAVEAYDRKLKAGRVGFSGRGGRAERAVAMAASEGAKDAALAFTGQINAADDAIKEAEISQLNKQVSGATATQQAIDAADASMVTTLKSSRTAFKNQFVSVKDALLNEQQSQKINMKSVADETASSFRNPHFKGGGWARDDEMNTAKYTGDKQGWNKDGKLWQQVVNHGDNKGTTVWDPEVTMDAASNPEPDWSQFGDLIEGV